MIWVVWSGPVRRFDVAHPPRRTGTLIRVQPERRGLVGLESESGVIRTDPPRVRVRNRDDRGGGQEGGSTPSDGARSDRQRVAQAAEEDRASEMETKSGGRVYRCDSGRRPQSTAEAAAHSASDLGADSATATGLQDRGTDGSPLRA